MKPQGFGWFLPSLFLLFTSVILSPAQDPIFNALRMVYSDVAEMKRKAEAGDSNAQLALADTLSSQSRTADAMEWYRKSAEGGNGIALYRIGKILLKGVGGSSPQAVPPDPQTGIQLIFRIATNRYVPAYMDMSRAYQEGTGVPQDVVQEYAWLQLYVDSKSGLLGPLVEKQALNNLALKVDVSVSQEGKRLAAQYKAGRWPKLVLASPSVASAPPAAIKPVTVPSVTKSPPVSLQNLKLNGVLLGKAPFAIINGKTIGEGEVCTIKVKPQPINLKCLKIEESSVLIQIEGQDEPYRLTR